MTIKENVLKKILQRKFVNKKQTQATFYVERNSRLSRVHDKKIMNLNKFLVVKLLRAHEGCLGIGGRRRTR